MLLNLLRTLYRVTASILVFVPIFINLLVQGDIMTSVLYVPLGCVVLSIVFIHIDGRLTLLLRQSASKRVEKQSTTNCLGCQQLRKFLCY